MNASCPLPLPGTLPVYIGTRSVKPHKSPAGRTSHPTSHFEQRHFGQPLGRRAAGFEGQVVDAHRLSDGQVTL